MRFSVLMRNRHTDRAGLSHLLISIFSQAGKKRGRQGSIVGIIDGPQTSSNGKVGLWFIRKDIQMPNHKVLP